MGFWLRSSLAQTLNWVSTQNLHKYGAVLNRFLPGILANEEATKRTLQDDISQNVEEVQKIIGYDFNDRNLLRQAFTHPSYHKDCISYERLEYVGDSVLNIVITKEHFFKYPNLPPGLLSPLRAANVDTEKLARAAVKHSFHKYLRHGNPILTRRVEEFRSATLEYPLNSLGCINPPKVLADIVEALIGAIYIDCNFSIDITWQVVKDMLQPLITPETLEIQPVTKIMQLCQKNKLKINIVDNWDKTREFECFVDGKSVAKGKSSQNKDSAKNRAAHNAYEQVIKNLRMETTVEDH